MKTTVTTPINTLTHQKNRNIPHSTYRGRKDAHISRHPLYVVDLVRRQKIRPYLTAQ